MSNRSRSLFLEACGAQGRLQLALQRGRKAVTRKALPLPFALVGRDPHNDLRLEDPAISRRHAYLQLVAGRLWCLDLGSRCGIRWEDGSRHPGWLEGGRLLHLGPFRIRREEREERGHTPATAASNPLKPDSAESRALPGVTLEFVNEPHAHPPYRLNRVLTLLGQAPSCKVRLISSTVGKVHCSLLRTAEGLWVIDLRGRQGILVGGQGASWARLDDGDTFQVGKFVMRVHYDRPQDEDGTFASSPAETSALPDPAAWPPVGSPAGSAGPEHGPVSPATPLAPLGGLAFQAFPPLGQPALAVPTGPMSVDAEVVRSLLLPLASQFSLMQQQMFDQFQQSLVAMAQVFSGLHQEQMALLRQELDRLNELTVELRTLEARLSPGAPALPPGFFLPPAAGRSPGRRPRADSSPPPASPIVPASAPAPPPTEGGAGPVAATANGTAEAAAPDSGPPDRSTGTAPDHLGNEVHVWLAQRLAALQEERQSRWRKLFNFLWGKSG
jgi:pSer/pThr/pTyr-binding forkhead associated (FHA) protein